MSVGSPHCENVLFRRQWTLLVPVLTVCSHPALLQPLRLPLSPRLKFIRSQLRWRSVGKNQRIMDRPSPVTISTLARKNWPSPVLTWLNSPSTKYCLIQRTGTHLFAVLGDPIDGVSSRIRVRAANSIGHGPYSSTVKCQTKSLPPDVPQLECSLTTCNSIKLKWNTVNHPHASVNQTSEQSATRVVTYIIEMEGKDGVYVEISSTRFVSIFAILVSIRSTPATHLHIKSTNYKRIHRITFESVPETMLESAHGRKFTRSRQARHHPVLWKVSIRHLRLKSCFLKSAEYASLMDVVFWSSSSPDRDHSDIVRLSLANS